MFLEEARLAPAIERQLVSKYKFEFPGVTRLQLVDPIADASSTHKTIFQDIYLPEAILIFCLDKQVASGTYNFGTSTSKNVFKDHRIKQLVMSFDNKKFSIKEPNFGRFRGDVMVSKQLSDYHHMPMFGIRPDFEKLNFQVFQDGGLASGFPHVYIPLCSNYAKREHLVPATDVDGSCISRKSDLEIFIQFNENNSPNNSVFVIYAIYTNVAQILDAKNKYFLSPYLRYL